MPKLIVMVGLPGSGKSYIAKKLSESNNNTVVFSSDNYRLRVCGDENCQDRNQEVFTLLYKELREALVEGKECIFDATNVTRKDRARIFNQIRGISNVEVIAYVMRTTINECLKRDVERDRTVGDEVIHKFVKRYEFPQRFEGFSEIIIDNSTREDTIIIEERFLQCLHDMKDWNQHNPHHIHSLYDHSYLLANHFPATTSKFYAGILHDVGKMIVNHYDDQQIVHYYNHDCVGTYYILSSLYEYLEEHFSQEEIEYLLFLVNYHMKGHKDIRENNESKYRQLFGDSWYDDLIRFADADISASGTESIHDLLYQWIKVDKLMYEEICKKDEYQKLIRQYKMEKQAYVSKVYV